MRSHDRDGFGSLSRRGLLALGAAAGTAGMLPRAMAAIGAAFRAEGPGRRRPLAGADGLQSADVAIEVDQGVYWNLFSPLWGVDPEGKFVPKLAAEVPTAENGGISADGLNWRVKLRGDVKWHDGTPFTADDVKFNLELINNPKFRAGRRTGHELVRDIKVVSPTEITWRMEKALRALSRRSCPGPSSCRSTSSRRQADPNTAPFNNAPVGTGPFTLGRARAGRPHHAAGQPELSSARAPISSASTFKYIPDLTVLYTQFQTGRDRLYRPPGHHARPLQGGEDARRTAP